MEKTYNPDRIESHWYHYWESRGYFTTAGKEGSAYCIMLPPPNITGNLHMGHAFQHTLMDILIRYHRMQGDNTLWQSGIDHAGIATQMVVERQLERQGETRLNLGREKFIKSAWDWKKRSGDTITQQCRRLGTSMDWERGRFTLDKGLSAAVTEVFVRLHGEGLIYRGKRLVNWDPVLHTAISDLEVLSTEENGHMWHIRYPRVDGKGHVVVATTRPETMFGDAAIAVHPNDKRYQGLVGQKIKLPLTSCTIPVIADNYVDSAFGTGCVKITPAHDFNDYAVGQRHGLPSDNIFNVDATMNESAPKAYQGLDRYEARKQIVANLKGQGLLEKVENHKLMVPRGDRSGSVVEPYLTEQWYLKIQPLADTAIKVVEDGDIRFVPDNWSKTYFEWMRNIQDWCISRQLWWGHRIPAWYDEGGNIYVGHSENEIREKYHLSPEIILEQDPDVLDTWFSSALWPFSTLGWPEQTGELKTFYPTNVLITGFDIIFFWVARMIMMGSKFMDDVPFREVYITGLIRDEHGQKMSKSKGNILDPLDLIDGISLDKLIDKRTSGLMQTHLAPKIEATTRKLFPNGIAAYGTDSLRFTFTALATQGRDIRFDIGRIEGYRNFCNKLWNAARYVFMTIDHHSIDIHANDRLEGLSERWIKTRLIFTIDKVRKAIADYRFDLAAQAMYEFTWDEYCDWYLELSKITLNDKTSTLEEKCGTLHTLIRVLESLLRLMHPVIPFITEELWQNTAQILNIKADTVMLQEYPDINDFTADDNALSTINWIKAFILGVRRIRAERDIPPGKKLAVQFKEGNEQECSWLEENQKTLLSLGRLTSITPVETDPDDAVTALAGNMVLLVPLADVIDPEKELERIYQDIDKTQQEKKRIHTKLKNTGFTSKAPKIVVNKEKDKLTEITGKLKKLGQQQQRLERLLHKQSCSISSEKNSGSSLNVTQQPARH